MRHEESKPLYHCQICRKDIKQVYVDLDTKKWICNNCYFNKQNMVESNQHANRKTN